MPIPQKAVKKNNQDLRGKILSNPSINWIMKFRAAEPRKYQFGIFIFSLFRSIAAGNSTNKERLKIGIIEAKSDELPVGDGVAQAKNYAGKMQIDYIFATNGKEIYQISIRSGKENSVDRFPNSAQPSLPIFKN